MKEHVPRWIWGSVSYHFDKVSKEMDIPRRTNDVPMFVEGQLRQTRDDSLFFELRLDGPDESNFGSVLQYKFVINLFVQSVISRGDYFNLQRVCGNLMKGFQPRLPIYRIPDVDEGTDTIEYLEILECAQLVPDHKNRDVRIFYFGQVDPNTLMQRASVVGQYMLTVSKERLED